MIQPKSEQLIQACCPADVRDEVRTIIDRECTTEKFHIGSDYDELLERIQLAIIKFSHWDPDFIRQRIEKDSVDFRDLLMSRSFGDLDAHNEWWSSAMKTGKID